MLARFSFYAILVALLFSPILLLMPRLSVAAEWSAEPAVRVATEYNDNIRLTTQSHNSVNGSTVSPKLNLGVRSDVWLLSGSAEYEHKNYSGADDLDTNNQYFNLASLYGTERSTWQLNGSLTKASVLADQKVNAGNDQIINLGLVTLILPVAAAAKTHRIQEVRNISPSWLWSMDERKQLQLSYQYNTVSYVNGGEIGLSDSSTRGVAARLSNQIDIDNQVFFSVGYSVYRAPFVTHALEIAPLAIYQAAINSKVIASESKSTSYQAGITHNFSETMRGGVSGGVWKTSTDRILEVCLQASTYGDFLFGSPACLAAENTAVTSKTSSAVFNADLEKKFENTRVSVTLSRSFNPSSAGDQAQTDALHFGINQSITARLTGNLSINANKYNSETGTVTNFDYRSYYIEPSFRWQWTQEINIDMTYRYMHLKRSWELEPATSNYVYMDLIYQWPKISISR